MSGSSGSSGDGAAQCTQCVQSVQYGDTMIAYEVVYVPRKTLGIAVAPDLRVTVRAPLGASPDAIAARVRRRAPWIVRQRRELERYLPARPPRLYVSGATHLYLGRQYRLKVLDDARETGTGTGTGARETGTEAGAGMRAGTVKLARGRLYVWAPDRAETARIEGLLDAWYHTQALRVFSERLCAVIPAFRPFGIAQPELAVKALRSRWGSCSGSGVITLNRALIQAPKPHIDYVIAHELSHLIERNHGKRFYLLLDRVMPGWRERRRQLNESRIQ